MSFMTMGVQLVDVVSRPPDSRVARHCCICESVCDRSCGSLLGGT